MSEIAVTEDDEIVGDDVGFHMERMSDDNIWFVVSKGDISVDCNLYAVIRWWPWPRVELRWRMETLNAREPGWWSAGPVDDKGGADA